MVARESLVRGRQISVPFDDEEWDQLNHMLVDLRITKATFVRDAVMNAMKKHKEELRNDPVQAN